MNLNEIAYQLKEQGLSYIQIGFVLKVFLDALVLNQDENGTNRRDNSPITVLPDLHNSPVSGA